jgi:aminoglycoside 6'-N-acetyltransferase I
VDVLVRPVKPCDRDAWLALRCDLWPDGAADHAGEIDLFLAGAAAEPAAVLVAESAGRLVGLAELSLRPCAEGCGTSPVAYLEGWYVAPALRRRGVGAALIRAFEDWGRLQGCREAASDTQADNEASARAHLALGFQETAPVRCFRKSLDSG